MSQASSNVFTITVAANPVTRPVLPAWVPPAGFFADVPMTNTPISVTPSIYKRDNYIMNTPFVIWGGSAILRDYGTYGAQVYYSAGHESSAGLPNLQFTLICDFNTLTWKTANVPLQSNASGSFDANGYAADGTPYNPHSYLGLQEMPTAWGGGPKGTLVSFFWAGSRFPNRLKLMDVSRPQLGYSQLATRQPQNAAPAEIRFSAAITGGNYPTTVIDEQRQGWWAAVNGKVDYTLFISKSGDITQYPALGGNLSNGVLTLCPKLNLLVAVDGGYINGAYANGSFRALYIRNLATGAVTRNTTLGTVPALLGGYDGGGLNFHRPDTMGLEWVDELGAMFGLDQSVTPPELVKLTPPATNPAINPWTWSKVPVQHWDKDVGGQAQLQAAENGAWSKFRWSKQLQGFVFCSDQQRKPQIIKLT